MKILHIIKNDITRNNVFEIPPLYIVEMTPKEFQLVSFYLELEKRKPIMNVELDTKIGKEE